MSESVKQQMARQPKPDGGLIGAWERFVAGDDQVRGIRPEIAMSWYRCREQYRVDPKLAEAPTAAAQSEHSLEHDVVFTELGGLAASVSHEVSSLCGVVTVADGTGRILASWGDPATLAHAAEANLAPWAAWSECASGTNGMGTALESHGPVLIRGPEHWCQGFHNWVCAGVAVRDVVTDEPVAVLNISCWRTPLPEATAGWLSEAVTKAQSTLRQHAQHSGAELAAAFTQARARSGKALAALDASGKVVIADDHASLYLGVPAYTPAIDPAVRWESGLPDLHGLARYAVEQAEQDHDWIGSTQIFTHLTGEPAPLSIRPVFQARRVIGTLITFGSSEGNPLNNNPGVDPTRGRPRRIVGVRGERMILLRLGEVCFAESDGNDVRLTTDQGRMQAATQGLDRLEGQLAGGGFLRVHRRFLVNLSRVREVERGFRGELLLIMDTRANDAVPVSRRNASAVRRALGI
jgi:hypothetical protein